MAIESYTSQLETIQAAILTIVTGGQSVSMRDGTMITKANLADLQKQERYLRRMVTREESGRTGSRVRRVETG